MFVTSSILSLQKNTYILIIFLYFKGLTRECLITVFNFVKDKATKLTKWKGPKKTAILKDGHDLKSKVTNINPSF